MKHLSNFLIVFIFISMAFFGCKKDNESIEPQINNKSKSLQFRTEQDYLVFESFEEFSAATEELNVMDKEQRIAFESSNNFMSLETYWDNALIADSLNFMQYEDKSLSELNLLGIYSLQDTYNDQINSDLTAGYFLLDETGNFAPNIDFLSRAVVVNKNGLVKIEGKIYQYKRNETKVIEDGDPMKVRFLLNNVADANITVYKHEMTVKKHSTTHSTNSIAKVDGFGGSSWNPTYDGQSIMNEKSKDGWSGSGASGYRVLVYERFKQRRFSPTQRYTTYGVEIFSFRRTYQGWQRRFSTGALAFYAYPNISNVPGVSIIRTTNHPVDRLYGASPDDRLTTYNHPELFYSKVQAYGRDGANCTIENWY